MRLVALLLALAMTAGALPLGVAWLGPSSGATTTPVEASAADAPTLAAVQVDVGAFALEPMVAIAPDGTVFYTSLTGPVFTLVPQVLRSRDGGASWDDVTPSLAGLGLVPDPQYTLDPYLHVDATTGRVFVVHFYPTPFLAGSFVPVVGRDCNVISWSDDQGESWETVEVCRAADHQTLFTGPPVGATQTDGYPNVVYLCDNSAGCRASLDGGRTWPATGVKPYSTCGPQTGHGHASATDGTVYVPRGACEFSFLNGGDYARAEISISRDNGATFDVVIVDDTVGFQRFDSTGDNPQVHHDAYVSTDTAGNVYYFFLDGDTMPRLSMSRDEGRTWTAPLLLDPPAEVTGAKLGAVAAGAEGKLAFGYVATDVPGGWKGDMSNAPWHGYLGVIEDALGAAPLVQTTRVTPADDPLWRGECSQRCSGSHLLDVGMYDFVNLAIHPVTGMAWYSMMDMCPDGCQGPLPDPHLDAPRGAIAVQTSGPRLIE